MILWNFGINKIELINFFLRFSFILMLIQILLNFPTGTKNSKPFRELLTTSMLTF